MMRARTVTIKPQVEHMELNYSNLSKLNREEGKGGKGKGKDREGKYI